MIYKVVSSEEKSPDGTKYEELPKNWRKISAKEFAQSPFFHYSIARIEHRQMFVSKNKPRIHAALYWLGDDTGYAVVNDYWAGTIAFYAFGCNHEYVELSTEECNKRGIKHFGMCWHVVECKLCKRISSYDSSD